LKQNTFLLQLEDFIDADSDFFESKEKEKALAVFTEKIAEAKK
jgi:hypothetical protein